MGFYVNYTLRPGITQWLRDIELAKGVNLLRTSSLRFKIRGLMAKGNSFETQQDRDGYAKTVEQLKGNSLWKYGYAAYVGGPDCLPVHPAKFPLGPDDRIYLFAKWSHIDCATDEERKDFVSVNQELWSVINFAAAAGFVEKICIEYYCAQYCPGLLKWMLDNMNPNTAAVLEPGFMTPDAVGYDAKTPLEAWV